MMKAIISLAVPKGDLEEHQKEFKECNGREMTEQELKNMYVDWFLADKSDYIYPDEISVHFV